MLDWDGAVVSFELQYMYPLDATGVVYAKPQRAGAVEVDGVFGWRKCHGTGKCVLFSLVCLKWI